jgi:hypothetical protein
MTDDEKGTKDAVTTTKEEISTNLQGAAEATSQAAETVKDAASLDTVEKALTDLTESLQLSFKNITDRLDQWEPMKEQEQSQTNQQGSQSETTPTQTNSSQTPKQQSMTQRAETNESEPRKNISKASDVQLSASNEPKAPKKQRKFFGMLTTKTR